MSPTSRQGCRPLHGFDGRLTQQAVAAAEQRGLEVLPLSRFSSRPLARDGLLLGFAAVDAHEIRRGVNELATVLQGYACHRRFATGVFMSKARESLRLEETWSATPGFPKPG